MTVLPRGAKNRRGGRRPGWQLLTALLVLAILASSTLVFTNRVELLRLAVILSLWAAVLAAFVSVTYRRQSQVDSARARDMKYVYDLQLDREISARREYELSVEAHLRRQLAGELRAQAADEMSALRAELATLRANLQALLGTDLGERPALEFDRVADKPIAEPLVIPMPAPPDRVESSRVPAAEATRAGAPGVTEVTDVTEVTEVTEVVDVTEEVAAEPESPIIDVPEEPLAPAPAPPPPPWVQQRPRPAALRPAPANPYRGSHRRGESAGRWVPPAPPPQPVAPPTPWRPPETRTRPGRHRPFEEQTAQANPVPPGPPPGAPAAGPVPPAQPPGAPAAGRHWVEPPAGDAAWGRHRNADDAVPEEPRGQHSGGAPVADLMARLRSNEAAGDGAGKGGRRRRKD